MLISRCLPALDSKRRSLNGDMIRVTATTDIRITECESGARVNTDAAWGGEDDA